MPFNAVFNFDDDRDKRRLYGVLKQLRGPNRVELTRYRPRRSDRANAYYWAVVVPAAARGLTETQGEGYDAEQAHEFFKALFLSRPVVDRRTGELLGMAPGSSAVLDTARFAEFVDQVCQWLAEYCGVLVPPPSALGPVTNQQDEAAAAAGR